MLLLGGSYITWSLLMFLLQKYYRDDLTFNSYIVAFIHAVISCRCCELVWYIEQSMKLDQFGGDLTTPQYYAISFSAGYILYDTILGFHTDKKLYIMVHHFITLFTLVFALLVEKCGPELILSTWGAEISGPCLNMRTFFQNSRFKSSVWSLVNDIVFIVSFVAMRFGLGGLILSKLFWSADSFLVIKIAGVLFSLVNFSMFTVICFQLKPELMKYKKALSGTLFTP